MIPLNKVLDLADFAEPELKGVIRDIFPHEIARFGPDWPTGGEYRKHWEVGMAVLALQRAGAIHPAADVLGVGAGNEPTSFYLTNHVRSVHATDLYLPEEASASEPQSWAESANVHMLRDPGRYWPGRWNPRRLIVQHMNALDLRFEDGTFDAIFSSGSIEHFGGYPEVRRAAREMARVLKPGGVLTLSTEFRLAGSPPGLPGILMFDEAEIANHIIDASGLEILDAFQARCSRSTIDSADEFLLMAQNVTDHVKEFGEIIFHKLDWPKYPIIALRQGELLWTSCHLALRKV